MDKINDFKDLNFLFIEFFDIDLESVDIRDLDSKIPSELRFMYKIREINSNKGNKLLFNRQDELIPYDQLDLDKQKFDFIFENQSCWTLQTELNKSQPKVYQDGTDEIGYLKDFIITYILQEFTFSLEYVNYDISFSIENLKSKFICIEPLWTGKKYVYRKNRYNFYLAEDKGIAFIIPEDDISFFGTNSKEMSNLIK